MKCLAIVSLIAIARAQSQQPSFQTRTDLVNVVVTVRDQHNNLITNLDKGIRVRCRPVVATAAQVLMSCC